MIVARLVSLAVLFSLCFSPFVSAADITWNIGNGTWDNTAANWSPGQVPDPDGVDSVFITNGSTVTYNAGALGDLTIDGGQSVNITGGSTWRQTTTHLTRVRTGTLNVDGGTFIRTVGSNFHLARQPNTSSTMNLHDADFTIGGELWFGHSTEAATNQVAVVNMDNSDISAAALWFWDSDDTGNDFNIDFTGWDTSTITLDFVGRRDSVSGSENDVVWETLWNEGLITVEGRGFADGLAFDNLFTTSGSAGPAGGGPGSADAYTLQFLGVPEPTSMAVWALTACCLAGYGYRRMCCRK